MRETKTPSRRALAWAGLALALLLPAARAEDLPVFDKLWDYDHPDKTEEAFRGLLPKAREAAERAGKVSEKDRGYLAELLTQLARAQGLQRKFKEAHATLDEAEKLLAGAGDRARVRSLLERGRVWNSSKEVEKSKPLFTDAWELAKKAGEENLAVDAAHMLAIVETPAKALEWSEKAIAYAEQAKDPQAKRWLGPLYNNTGWTHYDKKDYAKALATLEKARAWFEANGKAPQIRIARYSVAKVQRALGQVKEALAVQEKLLEELKAIGEEDGYFHEEVAECKLLLDPKDPRGEAKAEFKKAYDLLSKDEWLVANEAERLARLKKLGGVE